MMMFFLFQFLIMLLLSLFLFFLFFSLSSFFSSLLSLSFVLFFSSSLLSLSLSHSLILLTPFQHKSSCLRQVQKKFGMSGLMMYQHLPITNKRDDFSVEMFTQMLIDYPLLVFLSLSLFSLFSLSLSFSLFLN